MKKRKCEPIYEYGCEDWVVFDVNWNIMPHLDGLPVEDWYCYRSIFCNWQTDMMPTKDGFCSGRYKENRGE